MSLLILIAATLAAMLSAQRMNEKYWPRRHGEIRPSSAWLIAGSGIAVFFGGMAACCVAAGQSILFGLVLTFTVGGALMIGYYFHRRIMFRKRGLYEVKAGRVFNAIPYACAWQCQLGEDIEREGIIIQGVGARRWAIPGATSRVALSEALWCLKEAGVRLPEQDALKQRFGITPDMIEQAAPLARSDHYSDRISL